MLVRFRFFTAGESHGQCLLAIVDGVPSGLELSAKYINDELRRRQVGYGRSERMRIECDEVELLSGVRHGRTIGGPIAMRIVNRDYENWKLAMQPEALNGQFSDDELRRFFVPRPGHADFAGAIKYAHLDDLRNVLERASARETAARVAVGAVAKRLCEEIGITIFSHVVAIGPISVNAHERMPIEMVRELAEKSELRCADADAEAKMKAVIDEAAERGDSVGGIFEVIACGVPIGLGSYSQWDRRLDARLACAVMSIQGIKGVEIGLGFNSAKRFGSEVHDEFLEPQVDVEGSIVFIRRTNNAGGIEGGVSNGMPILVRAAMKPIATLKKPLRSIDLRTLKPAQSHFERADVCAVPAAAVVGEAMVAIVLVDAVLEKFGGDSVDELKRNVKAYNEWLQGELRRRLQ
ncbi:MAG: hypothetical protein GDYSWBUE_000004 [Candidatus Fervidibacterota bacterium]